MTNIHLKIQQILFAVSVISTHANAQSSVVNDSTKIRLNASAPSACVTVNGVRADGSAGTPQQAPYNGGQWYATVAAASAAFGVQLVATSPGVCVTQQTCFPGSVNNPPVSCGGGYTGTMYTTTTTTCPGGLTGSPVTTTSGYNTSNCVSTNPTPNCNTGIANGTGYTCASILGAAYTGTAYALNYTSYTGGGSCTTTFSGSYNTSGCSSSPPNCNSGITDGTPTSCSSVLGSGYTGTAYAQNYTTYSSGGTCTITAKGTYDTSGCTASSGSGQTVLCTPGTTTVPVSCPSGHAGATQTMTTTCPSGPYVRGTVTPGAVNDSACPIMCTPSTSYVTVSCPFGSVGSATQAMNTTCPNGQYANGTMTAGAVNTSGCHALICNQPQVLNSTGSSCVCANGATNSTCTLPVNGVCANGSDSGRGGNPEEGLTPVCATGSVNVTSYTQSGNCVSQNFSCKGSGGGSTMNCGYLEFHCQ